MRALASSTYSFVLEAVAGHLATPAEVLTQLVPSEIHTSGDGARLIALIRNPNTPESALRRVPALILPRLSVRDDHYGFVGGVALAKRPDTSEEALVELISDSRATTQFRKVVARQTTHAGLRQLLESDRSEQVRRAARKPRPPAPAAE
jgi:hypothetical protein